MKTPMVSVVVPVKNGASFVADCLSSLVSQTFQDFEVILVDDHSSDESLEKARQFSSLLQLRLTRSVRKGPAAAINRGMSIARGVYIARQDVDDISYPTRLQDQVAAMESNPDFAVLGCRTDVMDTQSVVQGRQLLDDVREFPTDPDDVRCQLESESVIVGASVLMRSQIIDALGGYREQLIFAEDYDLWLRAAEKFQVASLPEYAYCYRRHSGSMWRSHKSLGKLFTAIVKDLHLQRKQSGQDVLMKHGESEFWNHYQEAFRGLPEADLLYLKERLDNDEFRI